MKTMGRLLIVAVLFLGSGLWTLLNYCHGTTGVNFGWPADGSKLSIDLSTMGAAVWIGIPLVLLGLIMLTIVFIMSIVVQFMRQPTYVYEEEVESTSVVTMNE